MMRRGMKVNRNRKNEVTPSDTPELRNACTELSVTINKDPPSNPQNDSSSHDTINPKMPMKRVVNTTVAARPNGNSNSGMPGSIQVLINSETSEYGRPKSRPIMNP